VAWHPTMIIKNRFRQSENLMPIHINANPMEFTLSNLCYLPNVNYFLPFFTSFVCTCVLTTFFFEPCFVHLVLGLWDILVILGSNLCLWSLKSSTKVANWRVRALGALELEDLLTFFGGRLICHVSLWMTTFF
jgi:hypothetical protein